MGTPPTQLSSADLKGLECHFNWNICDLTDATLIERINAVKGHIRENAANILPQSHCLLAYLISQKEEMNEEVYDNLLEAQKVLDSLNTPSIRLDGTTKWQFGIGYKAVVLGNLTVWLHRNKHHSQHADAKKYYKDYQAIKNQYEDAMQHHPEVLAMKAFSFGSFGHKWAKLSVEAYKNALLHEQYKNRPELLFGLAHSKSLVAMKMLPTSKKELFEIETILRRVIQLDDSHALAMLRLAKSLVKTNNFQAFEEIEKLIDKALKTDRKLSIIEDAGIIYIMTVRNQPDNNDKAMKLFQESLLIDSNSKNTLYGLGQCYFNKYLKSNPKDTASGLPEELQKASEYLGRDMGNMRSTERLRLAHFYQEMARFIDKEKYLSKAETLYKDVHKNATKEGDPLHITEACNKYATFLHNQGRIDEEINYLKEAIEMSFNEQNPEKCETRFLSECQRKLLRYASKEHMPETEALSLKGFIQEKRGAIHSAIFYYKEAINIATAAADVEDVSRLKEALVNSLLQASRIEHTVFAGDLPNRCFDDAKNILEHLRPSDKKYELDFTVMKYEIFDKTQGSEQLALLKDKLMEFEQFLLEKNKSLHNKTRKYSSTEEEKEIRHVLGILSESKTLLERAMKTFTFEVYGRHQNQHPYCYYPSPEKLKKIGTKKDKPLIEDQMKELLAIEYKLNNFDKEHKEVFEFLVEKQPSPVTNQYDWLPKFINIRNADEHNTNGPDMLRKYFPTCVEWKVLVRDVSSYAVEIWKRFEREISEYKKHKI